MEKRFLSPQETIDLTISNGVKKAALSFEQMLFLGILAGVYIGFGGFASIIIMQTMKNIDAGLMKFVGAMVFPVGLMLVMVCGAELFTGNNLMVFAVLRRKITVNALFRNWATVYLANFLGSVILAFLVYKSGLLQGNVLYLTFSIAQNKIFQDLIAPFIRGILCNILVVLAVFMATASLDITSKIFSCWFPIMLFVLSGYEHSVANMFFLSLAKFGGMDINWAQIFLNNLIPVTLGNIVGGAIIIPFMYFHAYFAEEKKDYKIRLNG
ncbi:formate/nitrite transporter family protein [Thermosediminibacter oceani]|uniref:Formate/nitrite transporter n=1 Tax=Thermosediminibacter oceani (strain ATCC BAA-1034 / DSM 16646 / JW/IW-1228P) TaxID=555079 RepID=D9S2B6_THEOJ|nr:formate/nitrite transporter family protein [Thermosediminibacter oceani]ADL07543.1 formate/nitrite transporter [Thermosediminibacter oceani DSM 16646]